ncbi:peroxiredoxin family protein [Croceitalea rosinachiae]|uniref:TlpA disulfide reductase family protein n=1 Tax=Croceitalea rosinachiae TaxID=3075596 RepID=A0ABU3AAW0_9FLAO|nr:TlpA disulfide reductase family protein [Croceitalea sp. F388]MDT0607316.1 TlpA disulfide reductase family protein [Croceitalea sp. F388]
MRKVYLILAVFLIFMGCNEKPVKQIKVGEWWANLKVSDDEILPFNFKLSKEEGNQYVLEMRNSDEVLIVDEITVKNDSILIRMPVFEGYISGIFTENSITGSFIKESLERFVPFIAEYGERPRFKVEAEAKVDVSGIWEAEFNNDTESPYIAKGIFYQNEHIVTGTIRTTTGDYRYLEGVVDGNQLKLSTFDGAHAFLFTANATDSTLAGMFYSGNHYVENFVAKRNDAYELPDANSLTYLNEGYEKFDFSFPNVDGKTTSLTNEEFQDKVVLVQIMGTWCPNCLDETKFYVDYLKKNPNPDLKMVALAFEYARTEEKAFKGIQRLKDRVGVDYPILLAQVGTSSKTKANEKLPMLNHILSYPTTIYIDKKGIVRKIHTGFNGPATGEKYEKFKVEFDETVKELLSE